MRMMMSILRRRVYARKMGRVFGPGLGSAFGLGIAFFVAAAVADTAYADSVADLSRPSSTIPGCVNSWNPTDPNYSSRTCEGQAVAQGWQERAAAIATARNVIIDASRDPGRTDRETVIGALGTLADAADAITGSFHPKPPTQNPFATTLTWMRQQFEAFHLPVPASLGDGFRTMAQTLDDPRLLITDRNAVYDRSAAMANALSEAVSETIDSVAPETDAAVLRAHQAAVRAAQDADRGFYNAASAAAAITKAAGPDHTAIADGQFRILQASVARHPNQSGYMARTGRRLSAVPDGLFGLLAVCAVFALISFKARMLRGGFRAALEGSLLFILAAALSWLPMILLLSIGLLPNGIWPALLWLALFGILFVGGHRFVPARLKKGWFSLAGLFGGAQAPSTHGTAHFSEVEQATGANHLAPAAPADAFSLGWLRGTGHLADGRFRQGGHILTCAPTGAGKGIGAVIPNLLDYPGSAFVLDFKGENYAVTARARREAGQEVFLIDPFGITGAPSHGMNWLDALDPDDPDVVALAGAMAEMLVVSTGRETDPHWTETARELLRGLLIYVAGLPTERRSMSELRAILTGSEDDWAEVLADMLADPLRGHRIVARTATAHLNRPEKERGSVLSTLVRHTAWLDDPRLARAFSRHDFDLRDLKRRRMTVYLALPPDRLRACLGFVRGFIGLALDAMTATQGRPAEGKPAAKVAFFLDEFGQLGRMDSLADNITLLRGYGAQLWLFVQDLSQLKAVYPRWQSFLANTTQQFFGTADYDTAKYLSDALGQFTVRYRTSSQSSQTGFSTRPGGGSAGSGEHLQGRSLMTPDEVMRLGPTRPIVMMSGEAPYLLDRLNYLTDAPYADRFDPNPMHFAEAAQ
jgi:type IV secretory pathway TraG/TraD family ATPase VirD4